MNYRETDTYIMYKKLTAEENRKAVKKALWQVPVFMVSLYTGWLGFIYFIVWLWNI